MQYPRISAQERGAMFHGRVADQTGLILNLNYVFGESSVAHSTLDVYHVRAWLRLHVTWRRQSLAKAKSQRTYHVFARRHLGQRIAARGV